MSLPKTNKQTKIPWLPHCKRALDNHTLSFHSNTTNHNPSKDETFCSIIIHFSTNTWVYKKKKDTKCFVEGLSGQTVKREKEERLTRPPGTLQSPKNGHGISENKSKNINLPGTWLHTVQQPFFLLLQFSSLEKKVLKRGVIATTTTTNGTAVLCWDSQRGFPCPFMALCSYMNQSVHHNGGNSLFYPKRTLLPSYYFSLSWFFFLSI